MKVFRYEIRIDISYNTKNLREEKVGEEGRYRIYLYIYIICTTKITVSRRGRERKEGERRR